MGLFDFVGTFFFLSLGITFVLILLLVYHFKQRLTEMEQKSDKMFEIINTIVKEMGNIKRAQAALGYNSVVNTSNEVYNDDYNSDDNNNSDDETDNCDRYNEDNCDNNNTDVECLEDIQLCSREPLEPSFREVSEDREYDARQEDVNKFFNIHGEKHEEEVKVVSVDLTYHEEDIQDNISELEDEFNDNDNDNDTDYPVMTHNGEEIIQVNKLEEMSSIAEESSSITQEHQVPYNKMTLTQLRAYVVSKGLLSDSSKYKKAELVKLCESNEE